MENGGIERGIVWGVGGQNSAQERERRGTYGMVIKQMVDHVIFGWNGSFRKEDSKKNVAHPKILRVIRKKNWFSFFLISFFTLHIIFLKSFIVRCFSNLLFFFICVYIPFFCSRCTIHIERRNIFSNLFSHYYKKSYPNHDYLKIKIYYCL